MSLHLDDPGSRLTACGMREDEVRRIMAERVAVWLALKAQARLLAHGAPRKTSTQRTAAWRARQKLKRREKGSVCRQ
jgi:hypothetical protein